MTDDKKEELKALRNGAPEKLIARACRAQGWLAEFVNATFRGDLILAHDNLDRAEMYCRAMRGLLDQALDASHQLEEEEEVSF